MQIFVNEIFIFLNEILMLRSFCTCEDDNFVSKQNETESSAAWWLWGSHFYLREGCVPDAAQPERPPSCPDRAGQGCAPSSCASRGLRAFV